MVLNYDYADVWINWCVEANRERSRMLNHLLAGVVALGSLVLFLSGFLFPEVQRKPDLAWSGVALLYALLLFAEGDHTSGGELLGHIASAALILWFGWQTLQQRRQFAAPEAQTAIPGSLDTLMPFLKEGWGRILVTYGEASVWVQGQLGKGDSASNVKASPAPLQDVKDEDWEDGSASASLTTESPSVSTSESPNPETPVDKEVSADIPSALEPSTAPELPLTQEPPAPSAAEDSATATQEVSSESPKAELAAEPTPAHDIHQENPSEEAAEEDTHASIPEDDDGSWPPEDPVT